MKEARLFVDFNNDLIEDDLVLLSASDTKRDSKGKLIHLKEGLKVKVYSDDLSSCNEPDNLIAEGLVEANTNDHWPETSKWNCRINAAGIYNESQK
jgi:hypothetical protein